MSIDPSLALCFLLQTNNELEAQRVATEFAFRKRLREMEKVYSELKWQEKNVSVSQGMDFLLWDEEPHAPARRHWIRRVR